MRLEVVPDADALAARAAEWLSAVARADVAARGRFVLGVSGGSTPGVAFRRFAQRRDVPWARVVIVQIDERLAPDGHPDRNRTDQLVAFAPALDRGARFVGLAAGADLRDDDRLARSRSALRRAAGRPPTLDVAQLGLGEDGHTASLVAGDPALDAEFPETVALTREYRGRRRLTVTARVLSGARRRLWLVSGSGKADVLPRLLAGDATIPAGRVNPRGATVLADAEAAIDLAASVWRSGSAPVVGELEVGE